MEKKSFVLGCLFAFLSVLLGAFGEHTLREIISPRELDIWETAVRYMMYHAFALFIVGWAAQRYVVAHFRWAGWSFIIGIVLFSGSLFALVVSGERWLGAVTPFGGSAFLFGWGFLVAGFWKSRGDLTQAN
ncbi:MAG TPA: DUF423 domain-containing protein [Bacteroidota bacterium]|nr:DUF423 domain-containing protein [Bacteroidota bacterium]